jgi:hypothetical protein
VLRIFGAKGEEAAGGWRRLHNEELYKLYASPNVMLSSMRWAEHLARMVETRNVYNILARKPEGKRTQKIYT